MPYTFIRFFYFLVFFLNIQYLKANNPEILGEARVGLNFAGYQKIKSTFHKKVKGRNDLYLEIYGQGDYLLKKERPKLKLRLKRYPQKVMIQYSKVLEKNHFFCQDIPYSITFKKRFRKLLEEESFKILFNEGHNILTDLENKSSESKDKEILSKRILEFSNQVKKIIPKSFHHIHTILKQNKNAYILPSHRNSKFRWKKIKLTKKNKKTKEVKMVLGTTFDKKQEGTERIRFELETEFEGSIHNLSKEKIIWKSSMDDFLCLFLQEEKVKVSDLSSDKSEEHLFYKKYYQLILKQRL